MDYIPPVVIQPLDFTRTKGLAAHGVTLTMPKR